MNTFRIISFTTFSTSTPIPDTWSETPSEDRIQLVVQSCLKHWTDKQLSYLLKICKRVVFVCAIGSATSLIIVGIPGIFIGGLSVVICLIGYFRIRREQIARLQDDCLQMEHILIDMKQVFDQIYSCIEKLPDFQDFDEEELDSYLPIFQELQDAISDLPDESHYEQLLQTLGQRANVETGIRGIGMLWVFIFTIIFNSSLQSLYIRANIIDKKLSTQQYDRDFLQAIHELKNQCWVMFNDRDQLQFYADMSEGTEFWCQNLAVLRSSLNNKSL